MYFAYKSGRLAKDPATFWYKGELGFFDNYIIPLAGKLKECGVFGVSSDEVGTIFEEEFCHAGRYVAKTDCLLRPTFSTWPTPKTTERNGKIVGPKS
jgi:hypothetical protein